MRYVLWTLLGVVLLFTGSVLHYTLPQYDVVRIVNTEVRRVDFGSNSVFWSHAGAGDATGTVNRDVFFIEGIRPSGRPIVYRNEDTGWIWPPYFKFDSANLQASARDLVSTAAAPNWVAMRHYGWRNEWFSIFPNATSVREIASPDDKPVNWFNIVFLVLFAGLCAWIVRKWQGFRRSRIDPMVDDIEEASAEARGRLRGFWRRITGK
ncbi:MAG: DUF1523 family protein [Pseudomonadota bacterium]